jgi:CO/xanthine dehydrogenase Mo-binding subunit
MEIADQPALGAGEPATVTTAPVVANAVFDASGAQVYACTRCRLPRSVYGRR